MPFCSKCGSKLEDGSRFCTACGTPVAPAVQPTAPAQPVQPAAPQSRKRPPLWPFITAAAVLVVGIAVALVLVLGGGSGNALSKAFAKTEKQLSAAVKASPLEAADALYDALSGGSISFDAAMDGSDAKSISAKLLTGLTKPELLVQLSVKGGSDPFTGGLYIGPKYAAASLSFVGSDWYGVKYADIRSQLETSNFMQTDDPAVNDEIADKAEALAAFFEKYGEYISSEQAKTYIDTVTDFIDSLDLVKTDSGYTAEITGKMLGELADSFTGSITGDGSLKAALNDLDELGLNLWHSLNNTIDEFLSDLADSGLTDRDAAYTLSFTIDGGALTGIKIENSDAIISYGCELYFDVELMWDGDALTFSFSEDSKNNVATYTTKAVFKLDFDTCRVTATTASTNSRSGSSDRNEAELQWTWKSNGNLTIATMEDGYTDSFTCSLTTSDKGFELSFSDDGVDLDGVLLKGVTVLREDKLEAPSFISLDKWTFTKDQLNGFGDRMEDELAVRASATAAN